MKLRITIEGKTYEVEVEVLDGSVENGRPTVRPSVPPAPYTPPPRITSPQRQRSRAVEKACVAPIAGTVSQVLVQPGDKVQTNDVVLILEAMKMESNIVAPVNGVVKSVNVSKGYRVTQGQVMVEFD